VVNPGAVYTSFEISVELINTFIFKDLIFCAERQNPSNSSLSCCVFMNIPGSQWTPAEFPLRVFSVLSPRGAKNIVLRDKFDAHQHRAMPRAALLAATRFSFDKQIPTKI
jgi:hypothetical protein